MSPTVRSWDDVQKHLSKLNVEDIMQFTDVFPDQIPSSKDIRHRGTFGSRVLLRETGDVPRIGNDLHNLPGILLKNFFACLRGLFRDDLPVESGVRDLKHRISLIRLRHQADMLGLPWNPSLPWQLEPPTTGRKPGFKALLEIHPADLVPDFPSDWLPYDPEMTKSPWDFDNYFNKKDYNDFYYERYMALQEDEPTSCIADLAEPEDHDASRRSEKSAERGDEDSENKVVSSFDDGQVPANNHGVEICCKRSVLKHLYETIKLLKDAGNVALLEENLDLAARRYDKAILYGAIVTMSIPSNHLRFATLEGYHLEWDPFIKVLISTRLNLTLLLLKAHFSQYEEAAEQAKRALHDLGPFCVTMGMIMMGADLDKVHRENEPEQNYLEAKALQAKAWFRLGSAQYELGEYCDAISSFEKSVQSTQLAKAKPDSLVIRRLAEAKREKRQKSKRHRKKFKFAFATNENNEAKCQSESDS